MPSPVGGSMPAPPIRFDVDGDSVDPSPADLALTEPVKAHNEDEPTEELGQRERTELELPLQADMDRGHPRHSKSSPLTRSDTLSVYNILAVRDFARPAHGSESVPRRTKLVTAAVNFGLTAYATLTVAAVKMLHCVWVPGTPLDQRRLFVRGSVVCSYSGWQAPYILLVALLVAIPALLPFAGGLVASWCAMAACLTKTPCGGLFGHLRRCVVLRLCRLCVLQRHGLAVPAGPPGLWMYGLECGAPWWTRIIPGRTGGRRCSWHSAWWVASCSLGPSSQRHRCHGLFVACLLLVCWRDLGPSLSGKRPAVTIRSIEEEGSCRNCHPYQD